MTRAARKPSVTSGYAGQDLRGRSFKGQDLRSLDFSYADLRGANFRDADCRGANFSYAKLGARSPWLLLVVLLAVFLAIGSGFLTAAVGVLYGILMIHSDPFYVLAGTLSLGGLAVFSLVLLWGGLRRALIFLALCVAIASFASIMGGVAGAFSTAVPLWSLRFAVAGSRAGAVAAAITLAAASFLAGAYALVGAWSLSGSGSGGWTIGIALMWALAGSASGAIAIADAGPMAGAWAGGVSGGMAALAAFIGWRALSHDKRYQWVRQFALNLASNGNTSFRGADLSDANFGGVVMRGVDLRGATLTRTCWLGASGFERSQLADTYLANDRVLSLLTTGEGASQVWRESLRGLNLSGVNFSQATLAGVDLRESNLQAARLPYADLSGANLSGTLLQGANLRGANLSGALLDRAQLSQASLTGACIAQWGLTPTTNLDQVNCDYVFLATNQRKPDNPREIFPAGEFAAYIRPLGPCLDLLHTPVATAVQWPEVVATALLRFQQRHPEFHIIAIERRGSYNLLIRLLGQGDFATLNAEYFSFYNQLATLTEADLQPLLARNEPHFTAWVLLLQTLLATQ